MCSSDLPSNVFARRRVYNLYVIAVLHHLRHLVEVHVPAIGGVVETPVFVLFDEDGFSLHAGLHNTA